MKSKKKKNSLKSRRHTFHFRSGGFPRIGLSAFERDLARGSRPAQFVGNDHELTFQNLVQVPSFRLSFSLLNPNPCKQNASEESVLGLGDDMDFGESWTWIHWET